jgi:FKBP-type peptidyl-prolyl cis-trans isomerase FkpA
MDVIAQGNSLVIKVNDRVTAKYVDEKREFSSGHIALQQHNPQTVVEFRKIEILEFPPTSTSKPSDRELPRRADFKTRIEDVKVGTGPAVKDGDKVSVHYVGTLSDGKMFDRTRDRGKPIRITLSGGDTIRGWVVGLAGMRVGGIRKLTIPPEEAYGSRGAGTATPPRRDPPLRGRAARHRMSPGTDRGIPPRPSVGRPRSLRRTRGLPLADAHVFAGATLKVRVIAA